MRSHPLALSLLLPLLPTPALAQYELEKLESPFQGYGQAVALQGTIGLVGAPAAHGGGLDDPGVVQVVDVLHGEALAILEVPGSGLLGYDVALSGKLGLAGAPYTSVAGQYAGAVHLFDTGSGAVLWSFPGAGNERLGAAVALSNDIAVVAGHGLAVHVLDVSTGSELYEIDHPSCGARSVAVEGDRIAVGHTCDSTVLVYDAKSGQLLMQLEPPTSQAGDQFGACLALRGDRLLVGAPRRDVQGVVEAGAAYDYDLTTGQLLHEFTSSTPSRIDRLANSVTLTPDFAVLGHFDLVGKVHLFDLATGAEGAVLTNGIWNEALGWDVAASGERLLVGAPAHDFVQVWGVPSPVGTSYCGPAVHNSTGRAARLEAHGRASVEANELWLAALSMPRDRTALLLNAPQTGFVQNPGGSQGNLCLGGTIARHPQVETSGASGSFARQIDLSALPRPGGTHAVLAGETWHFQVWYRDRNPTKTSNFTDAVSVAFL